ncbi:MAG: formate dehydrogenase subunit alpha, partial [Dehalococcoidales bacterium]
MDKIRLTIDSQGVSARPGMTVLEAALEAGIYIPTLCWEPDLKPYGGCRLCVVEIGGMRGLPTACTTQATDGMMVQTSTPEVNRLRRDVVELLIADHPMDCLTCVKNQMCELQKVAAYLGITERRFQWTAPKRAVDASNPFFTLDRNYCILCARCTRACDEVTVINAIEIVDRGYDSRVSTFGDKPLMESICQSCGECVVRCPVAALVPKNSVSPTSEVETICPYCGVGCMMYLGIRDGNIVSVRGSRNSPANTGRLCVKGRYGISEFVHHPERLRTPLIRKDGRLTETSWEEALDLVASRLAGFPKGQVAVMSSAKCTNEENYIIQKFTRILLGTNSVDHCARLCHSPSVAGLAQSFGSGAMTNFNDDIGDAACILAIGSNTTGTHPIIGFNVKKATRRGAKLIVANPREIRLVRYADIWLRQKPGSDVALLMAMAKVIIDEGLLDSAFIRERCENFDAFKESLDGFDLAAAAEITGVPRSQIAQAARMYATSNPASIIYGLGITQHSHGTDNVLAIANLAMLTGNIGKPGSGVNPLRGQNNVQGACDMGALPNVYPGYQSVADPAIREKFEAAWGSTLPSTPGLTTTEIFEAAYQGRIKAFYLIGENPVLSEPDIGRVREAIKKLDFFVAQDIFLSETAELADVVLPAAAFAEKDGTFTNTERRVQRVRKAIPPLGDSRPDWLITCQIAQRMGGKGFDFEHPSQILDEIARLTPSYGGISFERLEAGGLQWPCPTREHPGTAILHTRKFTRGRGRFIAVEYKPPAELPDDDYPLVLTTGRSLFQYHTGSMTRRVKGLNIFKGEEKVEINPGDAQRLGIADDDWVEVTSRRGQVTARARVTEASPAGVVFMTFHFAESPTNVLTNPVVDPVAKIPEFKV